MRLHKKPSELFRWKGRNHRATRGVSKSQNEMNSKASRVPWIIHGATATRTGEKMAQTAWEQSFSAFVLPCSVLAENQINFCRCHSSVISFSSFLGELSTRKRGEKFPILTNYLKLFVVLFKALNDCIMHETLWTRVARDVSSFSTLSQSHLMESAHNGNCQRL